MVECRERRGLVRRHRYLGFGCFFAVAGVGLYLTPHCAVRSLREAAAAGDTAMLSERVDFPALRESLRQGVAAQVSKDVGGGPGGAILGIFGGSLAMALLGPMIDAAATPAGVLALMNGETPENRVETSQVAPKDEAPQTAIRYVDLDHFVLSIEKQGSANPPIDLVFRRDGLVSWKLVGVRFKR